MPRGSVGLYTNGVVESTRELGILLGILLVLLYRSGVRIPGEYGGGSDDGGGESGASGSTTDSLNPLESIV